MAVEGDAMSFRHFKKLLESDVPPEVLFEQIRIFSALPTNTDKARFILNLKCFKNNEPVPWSHGKSVRRSTDFLRKADEALRAWGKDAHVGRCLEGIRLVNEALCLAPCNHVELMHACLLCRAEMFCKLNQFKQAEVDLNRVRAAITPSDNPPDQPLKDAVLVSRLASQSTAYRFITVVAHVKIFRGDYSGAAGDLLYAGKLARASESSSDAYYLGQWKKIVDEIRALCAEKGTTIGALLEDEENKLLKGVKKVADGGGEGVDPLEKKAPDFLANIRLYGKEHQDLPGCSDAISMEYSEEKGRHMVAKRYIPAGSCLVIEPVYAAVLTHDRMSDYCYTCKEKLKADLHPCVACAKVRFCSEKCRDGQLGVLHRLECGHLGNLLAADDITPVGHLAHNIIMRTGWDRLRRLRHKLHWIETQGVQDKFLGLPEDDEEYLNIFGQVTHEDKWKKHMLFQACAVAVYLTLLLARAGYFRTLDPLKRPNDDDTAFVAGLIYRHMLGLKCNRFALVETTFCQGRPDGGFHAYAKGVSSVLTLFNHACTYGCCWDYVGDKVVVHSLVPFDEGQEVTINFGYNYAVDPKAKRQQRLKEMYSFQCNCIACVEDWPMVSPQNDIANQARFLCPKCRAIMSSSKCKNCGINVASLVVELPLAQQKFDAAKNLLAQGRDQVARAKELTLDYINFLHPVVDQRSVDLVLAINCLRRCFALQGRIRVAPSSPDSAEDAYEYLSIGTG